MSPAVSVIIPCYNQGHFLAQAIRSVQAQTFANWELIIVDDGSSDGTQRVASEFRDPRINYLHQDNSGLSAARNAGIRATHAPLIALLDADDTWEPVYLERMLDCLNRNLDAAAAYCGYAYSDEAGRVIASADLKMVQPSEFHKTILGRGNWLVPSAVVLRRYHLEQTGLFDEKIGPVADADLWVRLSEHHSLVGLAEILVKYRVHEGNMSKDPEQMISAYRHSIIERLGPPDGNPEGWEEPKRKSFARFYRYAACAYSSAGNIAMGAQYFMKLYGLSKELALSIGLWRDFARAHMSPPFRGCSFSAVDWGKAENNHALLIHEITKLAPGCNLSSGSVRRVRSAALLAMAEEGVYSGFRIKACAKLCHAVFEFFGIVFSKPFWGTVARTIGCIKPKNS